MVIIIKSLLGINILVLLYFYMHMFQLNYYFLKNYCLYLKNNLKKIIINTIFIILILLLLIFQNNILNIIIVLLILLLIGINIQKGKSKIPLKITKRVIRMFLTEVILITIILLLNNTYLILGLLNGFFPQNN